MEIDKENLEKALNKKESPKMPKDMEIGFHQGALNTLAAERIELYRMIQNVEKIMGMHISRLKELGVEIKTKKE